MTVKLLAELHLEFLSLKGGYIGSCESSLVKMPHCWKSHATAHLYFVGEIFQDFYLNTGSMMGNRMKNAKEALFLFLKSLPAGCYFNIVSFGSSYSSLFKL